MYKMIFIKLRLDLVFKGFLVYGNKFRNFCTKICVLELLFFFDRKIR